MRYFSFSWAILVFAVFIVSCDNNSDGQDSRDSQIEETDEPIGEQEFKFEELDQKMQEIMDETDDDENESAKEIRIIKANGAKKVEVKLNIGAGKLKLSGGSSELLLAGFIYSDSIWKPKIEYSVKNNQGYLNVNQPKSKDVNFSNNDKYVWNLKFNNQIPLDFRIDLGAGLSEISLSDLNIYNFEMNMGVGKNEIDLRGNWEKSTTIHLSGGIGLSKIYIPQDVGVKIIAEKGIGAIDYKGLVQKDKNLFVNKISETSNIILTIYLKTGIGKIEIE
jgi:predicted membrane protein